MTRDEAAMKLSMHLMQCGMMMPIKWVEKNGEGSELMEAFSMAIAALRETEVPCKIGDALFGIRTYNNAGVRVIQGRVTEMYYGDDMRLCIVIKGVCRGEFGKAVFLTREEAEEALRRLEEV